MRAFVEVDLSAISHNIKEITSRTNSQYLAVVKADAYGHGLIPVAKVAIDAGARWLGTALLEEAVTLRQAGVEVPIIAWLTPPGEDFAQALAQNIDLSVSSVQLFEEILQSARISGIKPRVHFEVDTGMRRGGVLDNWDEFVQFALTHRDEYTFVGFWSHFARADEPDSDFNQAQIQEFENKLHRIIDAGLNPSIIHFSNSAATLNFPMAHRAMVRVGIAMYGLSPDREMMGPAEKFSLKPAMSIKAKLHLVKKAKAGDAVGYGGTEVLQRDTTLGVVVMGYSDGLPRTTVKGAGVTWNGIRAPLVGRISMDQCVVDLGPDSKAQAGDYVTVMGTEGYSIDEWAKAAGTINYEIVTRIASRVIRKYV